MTIHFSGSSVLAAPNVQDRSPLYPDTDPLSWVIGEVRLSLGHAIRAVQYFSAGQQAGGLTLPVIGNEETLPYDHGTALQYAKKHVHQAHGALQMINIDGVAMITDLVENLLEQAYSECGIGTPALVLATQYAQTISHALLALIAYLEQLLVGESHQPIKLFADYQALQQMRGADRIHPADLFFPDVNVDLQCAPLAAANPYQSGIAPDYDALRHRFESALLPFLTNIDSTLQFGYMTSMQDVIGEMVNLHHTVEIRIYWWVLHGFAEGVAHAQIAIDVFVKQVFARINVELRHASQGSAPRSERLLRDALFFIADISYPSMQHQQICNLYRLTGMLPSEIKPYHQIDIQVLKASQTHLEQAKVLWEWIAAGDDDVRQEFGQKMCELTATCSQLHTPPLARFLKELSHLADQLDAVQVNDCLGLEMAYSLLLIEQTLTVITHFSGGLADRHLERLSEHVDAMLTQLQSVFAGVPAAYTVRLLDAGGADVEQQLAGEMLASLGQVERVLTDYFSAPPGCQLPDQIDHVLHQIQGALEVRQQAQAVALLVYTRAALTRFRVAGRSQAEVERMVHNLGTLSFFLEAMQRQFDASTASYPDLYVDPQSGLFQFNPTHAVMRQIAQPGVVQPVPSSGAAQSGYALLSDLPSNQASFMEARLLLSDTVDRNSGWPEQIDNELVPTFMAEGRAVLALIDSALRRWQSAYATDEHNDRSSLSPVSIEIAQTLLFNLHTLKGSARSVGAMIFSDHMHQMESHVQTILSTSSPHLIEALQAHYDQGVQMFDRVGASVARCDTMVQVDRDVTLAQRLIKQCGEVAMTRSRLEAIIGTLQNTLVELTDEVELLQRQVGELEIAGGAGDASDCDHSDSLQAFTMRIVQSVKAIASRQKVLKKMVKSAAIALLEQGDLTRALQHNLMRMQTQPVASLAERLQRLTCQLATELDKQVRLKIGGGAVEMDGSVLEKLTAPLEHLLRNAILHGIEAPDTRHAAGKSARGELNITFNDTEDGIVITVSDDGQGLNLERIRDRALAIGLLAAGQEVSDAELAELIFRPGLSTAHTLTPLAGRGIGLHLVRSALATIGGRIAVTSVSGQGTQFTIQLPSKSA